MNHINFNNSQDSLNKDIKELDSEIDKWYGIVNRTEPSAIRNKYSSYLSMLKMAQSDAFKALSILKKIDSDILLYQNLLK